MNKSPTLTPLARKISIAIVVIGCASIPLLYQNCSSNGGTLGVQVGTSNSTLSTTTQSAISPAGGALAGGYPVTITGTGFDSSSTVTIGGAACAVTSESSTQIVCTAPAGTLGYASVVVTTEGTPTTMPGMFAFGAVSVGQPDLVTRSTNLGNSLARPGASVLIGSQLFVADADTARVAVFAVPVVSGASPLWAIGQTDLAGGMIADSLPNATALNLGAPSGLCTDGTRFMIADSAKNRVLVYNQVPTSYSTVPDYILGQTDSTGVFANQAQTAPSASSLSAPEGIYCDSGHVIVSDTGNNRVMIWANPIQSNNQQADVVLGQPSFTTAAFNQGAASPSATTLRAPHAALFDGTNFYVADTGNHRVLVWAGIPTAAAQDAPASVVLGQKSMSATSGGCSAAGFGGPEGLASANQTLYVADAYLNRILAFDAGASGKLVDGQAPSAIVGQSSATSCSANAGTTPSLSTLRGPSHLFSSGSNLYVADTVNNRILGFNSAPMGPVAADVFLGQSSASATGEAAATVSASSFKAVVHGLIAGSQLLVTDAQQNRVLVYSTVPAASGAVSTSVLGQPNATSSVINQANGVISAQTMQSPRGSFVGPGGNLYFADGGNNRSLLFDGVPFRNDRAASFVLGQSSMTTNRSATTASGQSGSHPGCLSNSQFFVPDTNNNRVLVYDKFSRPNVANGEAATFAVGQADLVSGMPNEGQAAPSANSLSGPNYIYCDAVHLIVADSGNHRVLVYSLPITSSAPAAELVLGQPDFVSGSANSGQAAPTAATMYVPKSAVVSGSKLYVADSRNNRILVWNSFPTSNDQPADSVFGQQSFTANFRNGGAATADANLLAGPGALTASAGQLLIADQGNNRLLIVPAP